jgi:hypothetical protein
MSYKLDVDGKFGPKTYEAIRFLSGAAPQEFAAELLKQRKKYYDGIVTEDESQKANLNGWYNRLRNLAAVCGVTRPV